MGQVEDAALEADMTDSIFMGMMVTVKVGDQFLPVVGFETGRWLVDDGGTQRWVSYRSTVTVKKSIKHSDRFISIYDLSTSPLSSEKQLYIDKFNQTMARLAQEELNMRNLVAGRDFPNMTADQEAAFDRGDLSGLEGDLATNIDSFRDQLEALENDIADTEDRFDALRVNLKLKPRETLENCYLIVRARYLPNRDYDPELHEEGLRSAMHAQEIGRLAGGEERKLSFILSGFTRGPQIQEMSYHLYSGPKEIPTDFSEQRLPLSEAEAFDFLYADFVSSLGDHSHSPQLFKPLKRDHFLAYMTEDELNRAIARLQINLMGFVDKVDLDIPDPAIQAKVEELLRQAKFFPAAEGGVPIDSSMSAPLAQLIR